MLLAHHLSAAPLSCFGTEELCLRGNSIWVLKSWKRYLVLQLFWLLSHRVWGVEPPTLGMQSQTWASAPSCTYKPHGKINTCGANWCRQSDMLEHVSFHPATAATQTAADAEHWTLHACPETCVGSPGDRMCTFTTGWASSLQALLVGCCHPQEKVGEGGSARWLHLGCGPGVSQCVFVVHLV